MTSIRFCLASASPRRLELLRQAGFRPEVRVAGVREESLPGEPPSEHVLRLAESKAGAVLDRIGLVDRPRVVLAADTAVVLDRTPLGKPSDREQARVMLRRLSDRTHEVLTGVHVARSDDPRTASWVETTRVRFRAYPDAMIDWYLDTGEPLDKAGAYGIQGKGALLVDRIEGSWSNVVGLPVERVPDLLARVGIDLASLLPGR